MKIDLTKDIHSLKRNETTGFVLNQTIIFDDSNQNTSQIISYEKQIDFDTYPGSPLNKTMSSNLTFIMNGLDYQESIITTQ